jgi:hypothetical protein
MFGVRLMTIGVQCFSLFRGWGPDKWGCPKLRAQRKRLQLEGELARGRCRAGEQTGTKQAQRMSADRSIQTTGRIVGDSLAFDFSSLL